jgi:two-component system response regulator MprA
MMPGISGLKVCERIKSQSPVPILFLSARDEVADRVKGLESGGDDYLVKPFAVEELVARVRALLRRGERPPGQQLRLADLVLDTDTRSAARNGRSIELSSTEYNLLHYFLSNPRRVLTKEMILAAVWGYDFGGESNIVEVYIRYLRTKIEGDGDSRLIHTVRGAGYILREQGNN